MTHPVRAGAAVVSLAAAVLAGCSAGPGAPSPGPAPPAAISIAAPAPVETTQPPAPVAGWPQPLTIPKLETAGPVVGECAANPDGSIEPPTDIHATCITGRPDVDPGGVGTTTLTGHTTRAASVGALEHISQLAAGDTVTVGGRAWTVVETGTYPATGLPDQLFTVDGPRRLVLGTCHLDAAVKAGAPYTDTDLAVAVPAG